MKSIGIELKNESGLHARPASLFVSECAKYKATICIQKNNKEYNGKSILSVLSLGAVKGDKITITALGEDEEAALQSLDKLISGGFGEK